MRVARALLLACAALAIVSAGAEEADLADGDEMDSTDGEEAELRAEFDAMDTDGDGLIDRDELATMKDAPEESDIDSFLSSFDKDGDGKISFDEVLDEALNQPSDEDDDYDESQEGYEDESQE